MATETQATSEAMPEFALREPTRVAEVVEAAL